MKGNKRMATVIYIILSLLGLFVSVLVFNLTGLSWIIALYWVLSLLGSMIITFILFLLFLYFYGMTIKEADPKNMHYHRVINSILRLAFRLMRVKLVVSGAENIPKPGEKFVFVCNHQENYDIMAIMPVFKNHPLTFIAKEDAFDWFVLGHWIKMLGNIPINREANRQAAESIVKGIRLVKDGVPIAIFPEGKRSFGNTMEDFKPGALKLAMKPKVDILVGTIYDFSKVFKWWPLKRQKIYLHFHPLLTYDSYGDMNSIELCNKIKAMIQAQLDYYEINF